jgi:hypothetical protein
MSSRSRRRVAVIARGCAATQLQVCGFGGVLLGVVRFRVVGFEGRFLESGIPPM